MSSNGRESGSVTSDPQAVQANQQPHNDANVGQDRHVESDDEDTSSADTYGQRPGRFYGPDSSWRFYTRDERGLAASLDQAVCNDLSLQLYNIHTFKASLRNADPSDVRIWQSKQRWSVFSATKRRGPFQPRPKFSAWPLKPSSVPRSSEIWGAVPVADEHQDATVLKKSPESWKPSLNLQEELKAVVLRQAKEQLYALRRSSVTRGPDFGRTGGSRHPLVVESEAAYVHNDDTRSSMNDSRGESRETTSRQSSREQTPEFMDDDEAAGVILQPTVRHMISKQDELLHALHLSRAGQRKDPSATWKKQRPSRNSSRASTLAPNPRQGSAKRKSEVQDVKPKTQNDRKSSETEIKASGKSGRKRKRALGQRDWSEVLGMAAMMGWDPAAIDRAARRCAALFNEGMSMRFTTGNVSDVVQEKVMGYVPDMVPVIDDLTMPDPKPAVVDPDAFFCPYSSCNRSEQPYAKRWRLTEHLRRKHNHTSHKTEPDEGEATRQAQRSIIDISSRSSSSSEDEEEEGEEREEVEED